MATVELDWPAIDDNIDLDSKALNYVKLRLKAVVERELDVLLKKTTNDGLAQVFLNNDLGVPTGEQKKKLSFSQQVYSIGSSVR